MGLLRRIWGSLPSNINGHGECQTNYTISTNYNPRLLALFCQLSYWSISQYQGQAVSTFLLQTAETEKAKETVCIDYNLLIKTLALDDWKLQEYQDYIPTTFSIIGFRNGFGIKHSVALFVNDVDKKAVVVFRGTDSLLQLIINDILRAILLSDTPPEAENAIQFIRSLYNNNDFRKMLKQPDVRKPGQSIEDYQKLERTHQYATEIFSFFRTTLDPNYKLYLTGHSLGGHLAQVAAWTLLEDKSLPDSFSIDVFDSFAYPTSRHYINHSAISSEVKKHIQTLMNFKMNNHFVAHRIQNDSVSLMGKQLGDVITYSLPYDIKKAVSRWPIHTPLLYHHISHFLRI